MSDTSRTLHLDATDAREDILLGQDAETLKLLISTAIAAQNKRERASDQENIRYRRTDPKKTEKEEKEEVKN
ncbi:Peptidase M13 neprilysin [Penicillium samsonianum]|uniref:Peptidase M13 neprilysin n=1 Tax=Penicillium samsonianum TaxID=1882272 RepID=UPI0025478FEE|nr:Peptidase M13 neprilysin [Penicillium samsonianum]KAJ6138365.1 Peptidase M13 neprilysin [Penicillium samsonianum]